MNNSGREPGKQRSALKVPFGRTAPNDEDIQAVVNVLRSGHIRMGPACRELEERLARLVGCSCGVAVSSCTAALHSSLRMLDIAGKEVILPSLTFAATANAVVHAGGVPVFAESDPNRLSLDCAHLESLVSPNTVAVVPVHMFGIPCDMAAIARIARQAGIAVVEDCAYGLGSEWAGRAVGSFGNAGCFSFHVLKNVTTGEGGVVTTNDKSLAERLRAFRNHGMRISGDGDKSHELVGLNYKMTDIQAALGVSQLARIDAILEKKGLIASWYDERIGGDARLRRPEIPAASIWNKTFYAVVLSDPLVPAVTISHRMRNDGIETQTFKPVHQEPYYRDRVRATLPVTESLCRSLLALPSHLHMAESDVDLVVASLRLAMKA